MIASFQDIERGKKDMSGDLLNAGSNKKETTEASNTSTSSATLEELQERLSGTKSSSISMRNQSNAWGNFRQLSIRYIFTMLFGRDKAKSIFGDDSVNTLTNQSYEEWQKEQTQFQSSSFSGGQVSSQQFLVYSTQIAVVEKESTSFQAGGTVRTADGREINFNVDISMSREFAAYYEENYGIANLQLCDPLVINLDGDIAELSDQKFFFDIDGDGVEEEISRLGTGSGYLALDKNGDGIINDGNELFGTKSGNGFADLAEWDEDGNGWIDENDAIWSKLKIWCQNPDGTQSLYSLADKGVGAIYLQNVNTDFALNGEKNQTNGYIRNTGVFLYEDGNVGTMQHLDVAK